MSAVVLTLWLALCVTGLLFVVGIPLAYWLATTRSKAKPFVEALTALPLILPPTVLGFYLLIAFNPSAPMGRFWVTLTGEQLTFSFAGLVLASMIYSLPFMVQPLHSAFEGVGVEVSEAAASLRASPWDSFWSVIVPQSRRGFLTAAVLTFAHTIGEFGVVLMVGGNISGRTKTIAIDIYERVETLDYAGAHRLSLGLIIFAFLILLTLYSVNKKSHYRVG